MKSKKPWQSKTIISWGIGALVAILAIFDINIAPELQQQVIEAIMIVWSFIGVVFGRYSAKEPVSIKNKDELQLMLEKLKWNIKSS